MMIRKAISHYNILKKLGEGGMGGVAWRMAHGAWSMESKKKDNK